jgi:hypothetical protein
MRRPLHLPAPYVSISRTDPFLGKAIRQRASCLSDWVGHFDIKRITIPALGFGEFAERVSAMRLARFFALLSLMLEPAPYWKYVNTID